jgi:hypothetical protein
MDLGGNPAPVFLLGARGDLVNAVRKPGSVRIASTRLRAAACAALNRYSWPATAKLKYRNPSP